mmetsp:Transcript_4147/g.5357  ORF Transcript_4147/g.5357 Transcript_4147/m.5357 type:complete len:143 (+) Transcript_4147:75-503(+)
MAPQLTSGQQEVVEYEQRINEMRDDLSKLSMQQNQLQTQQLILERDKKKASITLRELQKLSKTHRCYEALGRAFVLAPVTDLLNSVEHHQNQLGQDLDNCDHRKAKVNETIKDKEVHFQKSYEEFAKLVREHFPQNSTLSKK